MVAEMVTATGWSWEYTRRHMDLHRYAAFGRLWRRSPPLQAMVQAYLGIESKVPANSAPVPAVADDAQVAEFCNAFAQAGIVIH